MSQAVEKLTQLVHSNERYHLSHAELRDTQVQAINERFQSRKESIKLLRHRAEQAGISEVTSLDQTVPLLFPHTVYKSYPESFLMEEKWDRLSRWLDTVATYRVPELDPAPLSGIDAWVEKLKESDHYVSCSSGTTGKSAMLVASGQDMAWCRQEAVAAYAWGSGVQPARDRRIFGLGAVALVPRNQATSEAYTEAYQNPQIEYFRSSMPPITVGSLTQMMVLRKKIADGTAKPGELQAFETLSVERQEAINRAVKETAEAIVAARHDKLHMTGLWANLYTLAEAVRKMGYSAKDFHDENSIYVGGGLKRAALPSDYREFVYETFNIAPERNYVNYSMQELHSGMPRCREGGRYHIPPWVVPLVLDKSGDHLLPIVEEEYEGRAAFFDLSIDGRWGGVISGDKVSIDFSPCACGASGPSIRDNIVRYSDLEGDDKIGCAGTVDAYVRGIA